METTFQNAITIAIVGFSSVLLILVLYAIIISIIKKLNTTIENNKTKKIATGALSVSQETFDTETIAIITAAINTTLNKEIVIKKIQLINPISSNTTLSNFFKTKIFQANNINIQKRRP